jgi:perosamine synthetase
VQLSRIEQIKRKRKQVAQWYQQLLAGDDRIIVPTEAAGCDLSWFVFVVRLAEKYTFEQRNKILEDMTKAGIQVSNYFSPVHLQPFIAEKFGFKEGDFPINESVSRRTIALPFYNNLSKDDVALVCSTLKSILDKL